MCGKPWVGVCVRVQPSQGSGAGVGPVSNRTYPVLPLLSSDLRTFFGWTEKRSINRTREATTSAEPGSPVLWTCLAANWPELGASGENPRALAGKRSACGSEPLGHARQATRSSRTAPLWPGKLEHRHPGRRAERNRKRSVFQRSARIVPVSKPETRCRLGRALPWEGWIIRTRFPTFFNTVATCARL